jgi:hypothetical protein
MESHSSPLFAFVVFAVWFIALAMILIRLG